MQFESDKNKMDGFVGLRYLNPTYKMAIATESRRAWAYRTIYAGDFQKDNFVSNDKY